MLILARERRLGNLKCDLNLDHFLPFKAEGEIEESDSVTFPRMRIWGIIVESVDINPVRHNAGKLRLYPVLNLGK